MSQIAITYTELKKHLQTLDLEKHKVSMIETECPSCGKPTTTTTEIDNVTVWIHTDCKTQVIFSEDKKEEVDA